MYPLYCDIQSEVNVAERSGIRFEELVKRLRLSTHRTNVIGRSHHELPSGGWMPLLASFSLVLLLPYKAAEDSKVSGISSLQRSAKFKLPH